MMRNTLAICIGILAIWALVITQQAMAAEQQHIRLPSDGAAPGTLALLVTWPDQLFEQDRYEDGAPVVVIMNGDQDPGFLGGAPRLVAAGFVAVEFLYPGGVDGAYSSDGTYDYRGPNCLLAARDVWLFALGEKVDHNGQTIEEIVGRPVHTDIMGAAVFSNGGHITAAVADLYQQSLTGLRFLSMWENGMGTQPSTGEIGWLSLDCDPEFDADGNGEPYDEGRNPRYDPLLHFAYDEQQIDYSEINWDPAKLQLITDPAGVHSAVSCFGMLFFDGNGNGSYDHRPLERNCPDTDGDGRIELNEDYPIWKPRTVFLGPDQPRLHYSEPVTRYLEEHPEVFGASWPDWVATREQVEQFWNQRAGSKHLKNLAAYAAHTRVINSFAHVGHALMLEDQEGARLELEGFGASGLWYRMNPDASYVEAHLGTLPEGIPDNQANISVPAGGMRAHAATGSREGSDLFVPAVMELADRTYYGGWSDQLDEVLEATGIPASTVDGLRFASATQLTWTPSPSDLFYDLSRGTVTALTKTPDSVELGPLVCIEEDSSDAQATALEVPPAGTAWFYVVRPNGLPGAFGSASDGLTRDEGQDGCIR